MHQLDQAHDRIRTYLLCMISSKDSTLRTIPNTISEADLEDKNPISNLLKPVPAARLERDYTILSKPVVDPAVFKKLKYENSTLKERLEHAVHLADMYREQCIAAEEEVSKIRDEIFNNKTMFQDRTGKLVDKLELTTKVCQSEQCS